MASERIEELVRRIIHSTHGQEGIRSSHVVATSRGPRSCEEEIAERFNIPRGETSVRDPIANDDQQTEGLNCTSTASTLTCQYNPQENYGYTRYNRRQRRVFPYSRNGQGSSSGRPRATSTSTRTEAPALKEVILLPKPSWNEVPKYNKAYFQERGYIIDSMPIERCWNEKQLKESIMAAFDDKLSRSQGEQVGFHFVKVIGNSVHPLNLPRGISLTGKVLLRIVKQGPVYVRSERSLKADVESDSEDDDADELPSMLPVSPAPFVPSSVPASVPSIPSMPSRVNSPQHIVVENHSMEDSAAASLARGNSKLSNSECIEQLMMMFPDMSRESLQDKLEAWNNDMQRVVTSILSSKEETSQCDDDFPVSVSFAVSPEVAVKDFRDHMVDKYVLEQPIRASHDSNILREMFRYLKLGQFNLRARPNVVFDGEDGMDADGLTRELCHMIMATMRDGKGGIILFEGQVDHLIPVHNEQYLASQYFKYAGQLIVYSFIHGGFGMTGLSRAIAEYLKSDDIDKCLQFLSVEDIPDLDVRQKLKQMQNAESEEALNDVVYKDDTIQVLLMQAGFSNELVKLDNKHRACQSIMLHVVFKSRKDELQQMKDGLESLSLLNFLRLSDGCMKYVFPLKSEIKVMKDDFLHLIDYGCAVTLEGSQKKALDWFIQYIDDVDLESNVKSEVPDESLSSLPTLAEVVQFVAGHPYLPSCKLSIRFTTMVYPDADSCFFSLALPTIHNSYHDFRRAMNTAITCQHLGYGRG